MSKQYLVVDGVICRAGSEADLVNYANSEGIEIFDITDEPEFSNGVYIGDGQTIYPNAEQVEQIQSIFGG